MRATAAIPVQLAETECGYGCKMRVGKRIEADCTPYGSVQYCQEVLGLDGAVLLRVRWYRRMGMGNGLSCNHQIARQ